MNKQHFRCLYTMMQKSAFVILFLLIFSQAFAVLTPPSLRCISVTPTGNVELTWIPPADPLGEFVRYDVYVSQNAGGPYTSYSEAGLATSTSNHVNTADQNSFFYYVVTVYNDGTGNQNSVPSDTLQTILPFFQAQSDTTVDIRWNPIHTPNLATSLGNYAIFRRIGVGGAWQLVDNQPYGSEMALDTFKVCSDSVFYRIEIQDNSGCTSVSAILKDLFQDNTAPAIPVIDSVSVDPLTGNIIVGWNPSTSPDTEGYLISYYDFASSQYIIIDTVYGINTIAYLDNTANGGFNFQQYGIAAIDTCYKGMPPTANTSAIGTEHRTIFTTAQVDFCNKEYLVEWTHYIGWDDLSSYEVYVSIEGNGFQLLGTVPSTDSTFLHADVNPALDYCYIVKGRNDRGMTTSSNQRCISVTNILSPDQFYINKATVVPNERNIVECFIDDSIPTLYYTLERSLDEDGPYFEVDRTFSSLGNNRISFTDETAEFTQTDYHYKVVMYDTCGLPSAESNMAKTIHLSAELDNDQLLVALNWTPYLGWDTAQSGVKRYEIYRSISNQNIELVGLTSDTVLSFIDDISNLTDLGGNFCYIVQAVEDEGNIYGFQDGSISNRVCLSDNVKIFIPNAFVPTSNGVNKVFKPVLPYVDAASYEMYIYNRYGQQLWRTTNLQVGWDGRVDGQPADVGIYVYLIKFKNSYGDEIIRRGTVALVR